MRRIVATLSLILAAPMAQADVAQAVNGYILPRLDGFHAATVALSDKAAQTCDAEALRPLWNTAFDEWLHVSFLHIGPGEDQGRTLAIAFWPDPKGIGAKQQRQMIAAQDPAVNDPAVFAESSVAVRGLFGLERLLYPAEPLTGDYPCALIRATAADLARMAAEIEAGWQDGFADALLTAGQAGNTAFLSADEATQALFTQYMAGLEFISDQRLARPMGTFERPRPERAEARASARSQRNVEVALVSLQAFAEVLTGGVPDTRAETDAAMTILRSLGDPAFAGVGDARKRPAYDLLQRRMQSLRETARAEVGAALGVGTGFNSADGD